MLRSAPVDVWLDPADWVLVLAAAAPGAHRRLDLLCSHTPVHGQSPESAPPCCKQRAATRAHRAIGPGASGEKASPAAPTVLPPPEPPSSVEPAPPPLAPTKQPSDHTTPAPPEPRPLRPASTHPWRRPFIRRRSA